MVRRDEFCPDLEDPLILPDPPVPAEVEDQATEEVGGEDVRQPTPQAGDSNFHSCDEDTEPSFPFYGWETSDSDHTTAETSLAPDTVANKEPPPLHHRETERKRRSIKAPKRLIEEKEKAFPIDFLFVASLTTRHDYNYNTTSQNKNSKIKENQGKTDAKTKDNHTNLDMGRWESE